MIAYCWARYWFRIVCVAMIFAAICVNQATALYSISGKSSLLESGEIKVASSLGTTNEDSKNSLEQRSEKSKSFLEFTKDYIKGWPNRIREDSKDSFLKRDNITALLLAGGASIALHSSGADGQLARNFNHHRVFHDFTDEGLNIIGSPWTHFGASALWYAVSAKNKDEFNKERAWTMMRALSLTSATTFALKAIRHNDAPNGKRWAWPSGHTSSSFAAASVLHEFYGPKVGFPAYALASLIGYRMMDSGDHWASDVVFGATLGWVVGHSLAGRQKRLEIAGLEVLPFMAGPDGSQAGISLVKRF